MPGLSFFGHFLELKPGKYKLKTWIKGKGMAKDFGRAWLELRAYGIKNRELNGIKNCAGARFEVPQGDSDWRPFECEFEVTPDTPMPLEVVLRTSFDAYGKGTVYADLPEIVPLK